MPRQASRARSEEHTSELQSPTNLVCRLLLEKNKNTLGRSPAARVRAGRGGSPSQRTPARFVARGRAVAPAERPRVRGYRDHLFFFKNPRLRWHPLPPPPRRPPA